MAKKKLVKPRNVAKPVTKRGGSVRKVNSDNPGKTRRR